jgi:mRNA-degrading endonuclease RelE of RelBE toxin-antitoxin system
MEYCVSLTENAKEDIGYFEVRDQRIIVGAILTHLKVDAGVPTKKRKALRPNPIAPWELRIDRFRIFYVIEGDQVKVVAVGQKEHNEIFVRGYKVEL